MRFMRHIRSAFDDDRPPTRGGILWVVLVGPVAMILVTTAILLIINGQINDSLQRNCKARAAASIVLIRAEQAEFVAEGHAPPPALDVAIRELSRVCDAVV